MQSKELIQQLYKTEYGKIVSVLCKLFGIVHVEVAEDLASNTFLLASETWESKGIPNNPTAWLYTVAKNKTKDYVRRNILFREKISMELANPLSSNDEIEMDLTDKNIQDSQLQMMFAICNPIIPTEAQIGLALRILCGFSVEEIAEAFLTNKETINKRLFRAKERLRFEKFDTILPDQNSMNQRLDTVLTTIYLLFNEGYFATSKKEKIRKELCLEAIRLNYFLIDNEQTNVPKTSALMSLMCFHSSRFEARTNDIGEIITYENQDRNQWNDDLIAKGNYYLIESAKGQEISKFHLEASIAYWHATKIENAQKWESILQLYNKLLQLEYSPIIALNRTFALSKVQGKEIALKEALKINLNQNHLYHALLAELYDSIAYEKRIYHLNFAINLANNAQDKEQLKSKLKNC